MRNYFFILFAANIVITQGCVVKTNASEIPKIDVSCACAPPILPQFLYATSIGSAGNDVISAYKINDSTGQLEFISHYTVGQDPYDLTIDQTKTMLYVMNSVSDTISQFKINRETGALTELTPAITGIDEPYAGPTMLSGTQFYVPSGGTNNLMKRYSVATDGRLTHQEDIAGTGAGSRVWYMRGTPDNKYLYATIYNPSNVAQWSVNQSTGALTQLTPTFTVSAGTSPWSIEVAPNGKWVYVANSGSNNVSQFEITNGTGQLNPIAAAIASVGTPVGIAITPASNFLYASNSQLGTNTISQFSINSSTGQLTALAPATIAAPRVYGMAIDKYGKYLYAGNAAVGATTVSQFKILSSGQLEALSPASVTSGPQSHFIAILTN